MDGRAGHITARPTRPDLFARVLTELPPPTRRCTACGQGHYAAVRFCPFCGTAQPEAPQPTPAVQAAPPRPQEPPRPVPVPSRPMPAPAQTPPAPRTAARAPSPVPQVAADPPRPPPKPFAPSRPRPAHRRRFRLRHAILAALAIAALAFFASRRGPMPASTQVTVGPAWTVVDLSAYRAAPLLRLGGGAPFSLRLDGERVIRVAPGGSTLIRPGALRALEARSGRGQITVTLTPRSE